MTSVIRVKRKRDCEPAEALLLAARKKLKTDPVLLSGNIADVIDIEEKVFRFAATIESDVAHHQEVVAVKVKDAIQIRTEQKELRREGLRKRKLSLPCSKLPKLKQLKDATISACQTVLQEKCLKFSSDKMSTKDIQEQNRTSKVTKLEDCEKCIIYHNDDHIPRLHNTEQTVDEIMCNNTKMLREKLNLADVSAKKPDDYVYDLYYCRNTNANWDMSELLYIQPYKYTDEDLLSYSESEEEYYEDEDDSNDEGNWRNDYPDDEDSSRSSSSSEDERERFLQQEEEEEEEDEDIGGQMQNDDLCQLGVDDMATAAFNEDVEVEAFYDPGANIDVGGGDDNF